MRLPLFAAILALLPLPALADVTARYSAGKEILIVEVDDGGNSRMGIEGKFSIIRREGTDYVAMTAPSGETKVAELSELLAIMSSAAKSEPKGDPLDRKFQLVAKGDATVGARAGSLWSLGPEAGKDGRPPRVIEVVMSSDPTLAPLGGIVRRTLESALPVFQAFIPESSGFAAKALELASKGAPLRIDKLVELQSVEVTEIDAKRFELPGPVVNAAEFLTAIRSGPQGGGFAPLP